MVKLYMNPEKLAGKIKTLRSLATSATINKGLSTLGVKSFTIRWRQSQSTRICRVFRRRSRR